MKKVLSLLIVAAICLTLAACKNDTGNDNANRNDQAIEDLIDQLYSIKEAQDTDPPERNRSSDDDFDFDKVMSDFIADFDEILVETKAFCDSPENFTFAGLTELTDADNPDSLRSRAGDASAFWYGIHDKVPEDSLSEHGLISSVVLEVVNIFSQLSVDVLSAIAEIGIAADDEIVAAFETFKASIEAADADWNDIVA